MPPPLLIVCMTISLVHGCAGSRGLSTVLAGDSLMLLYFTTKNCIQGCVGGIFNPQKSIKGLFINDVIRTFSDPPLPVFDILSHLVAYPPPR